MVFFKKRTVCEKSMNESARTNLCINPQEIQEYILVTIMGISEVVDVKEVRIYYMKIEKDKENILRRENIIKGKKKSAPQ